jgi:hypothetical protein
MGCGEKDHDQLPSVEEIRTSHTRRAVVQPNWCLIIFALGVVVVIALAVGLSLGLTEARREESSVPSRYNEVVEWLNQNDISAQSDLEYARNGTMTSGTASDAPDQARAAKWIADEDPLRLPLPVDGKSTTKFVQRYVLALLYMSLGGEGWGLRMNWMSGEDACLWYSEFVNFITRETFQFGAVCDDSGSISALNFPTLGLKGTIPSELAHLVSRCKYSCIATSTMDKSTHPLMKDQAELSGVAFKHHKWHNP